MSPVRWALLDARTITVRALLHWTQSPGPAVVSLLFPVLLLAMFGGLFGGAMTVPGGGDYTDFLVPGLLGLTMAFGIETTAMAVATDAAKGVTERFRSLPMSPSAVVAGRTTADMLHAVAGLAVMVTAGRIAGWQWHDGLARALAAVGLLLLLRLAFTWAGVYLGLLLKDPQGVVAVQILVWPFGFLSSAFVAPETMPGWLGFLAEWNPLSATVGAARELFGNPGWGGDSWAAQHAVELAIAWPLLLIAIFAPLSVRAFRRLGD